MVDSVQSDRQSVRERDIRQVRQVTWAGLGANVALSAMKLAAGLLGGSQAIVADGVHSLSDTSTDVAVLVGVQYWTAPADEEHPYGHGRIESVITSLISLLLVVVAGGLVYRALTTLGEPDGRPSWAAFAVALASIAGKEALYRWTARVGRRIHSSALIANAWHHRSDALSSAPVAVAVAIARLWPEWGSIDQVGSVVVSVFIIRAAWRIGRPVLKQLIDTGASLQERKEIRDIAQGVDGVDLVHAIRTRHIGSGLQCDLHVLVDGDMSVRRSHEIAERVKQQLLDQGPELVDVVVHVEPLDYRKTTSEASVFLEEEKQMHVEHPHKLRILFLCTGNSCRSQMAEGWARRLKGETIEPFSAGIETHGLNPKAVQVMAEAGVDITDQRSKHLDELQDKSFDYIVTVCDHAAESCPVFPGKTQVVHVPFDDPPRLARDAATEEQALDHYRRVRDEIRRFVEQLPQSVEERLS